MLRRPARLLLPLVALLPALGVTAARTASAHRLHGLAASACALANAPSGAQAQLWIAPPLPPGFAPTMDRHRSSGRYVSASVSDHLTTEQVSLPPGRGDPLEYRGLRRFRWHLLHGAKLCRVDVLRNGGSTYVRLHPTHLTATGGSFDDRAVRGDHTMLDTAAQIQINHLIEAFVVTVAPPTAR